MKHKGLTGLVILSLVCVVLQLLTLVSVPVSSGNLYLCSFKNFKYGVFGVCDMESGACSAIRIGYRSEYALIRELEKNGADNADDFELPSGAALSISKLLVVHVIALCFSGLESMLIIGLLYYVCLKEITKEFMESLGNYIRRSRLWNKRSSEHDASTKDEVISAPHTTEENEEKPEVPKKIDITPFLNLILSCSLLTFLASLLAFLIDILLFVPNLSYLGWLQLVPIIFQVLITCTLCFLKRFVSNRRYIQNDNDYKNDDMRLKKAELTNRFNDTDSDDGFYVYTGGFDAHNGEFPRNNNRTN